MRRAGPLFAHLVGHTSGLLEPPRSTSPPSATPQSLDLDNIANGHPPQEVVEPTDPHRLTRPPLPTVDEETSLTSSLAHPLCNFSPQGSRFRGQLFAAVPGLDSHRPVSHKSPTVGRVQSGTSNTCFVPLDPFDYGGYTIRSLISSQNCTGKYGAPIT